MVEITTNENFTLNVNGFYCFNSWFNYIDGFNNMFQLIIKNINGQVVEEINYKLYDGNPNVNDLKNNLNSLLLNKVLVSYDKQKTNFSINEFYQLLIQIIQCI